MLRSTLAGSLLLLASIVPAAARHRVAARPAAPPREAEPVPANRVGTWRLDSLLDQARVTGIEPGDVDPATFVLQDLRFDDERPAIVPVPTPFGSGTVVPGDGGALLTAKGRAAAFRIPIEKVRASEVGAIAWRVRSTECSEVALLRDSGILSRLGGLGAGFGPNGPLPPLGGGFIRFGGAPPLGGGGVAPGPVPGAPPPPPAGGAGAPPDAGAPPAVPPAGPPGAQVVVRGGGPGGPGGGPADFDPRMLLGGEVRKLEADGEWHVQLRPRATRTTNAFMGGGGDGEPRELTELLFVALVPEDKAESGVSLELEYVHLLDAKADYAARTAAACTVERRSVLHAGMYLNTPAAASWRLAPTPGAKLIAGVTSLLEEPFHLLVHATSGGTRTTLLDKRCEGGSEVAPLALDLSAYAGAVVDLELEVVEEGEPNVVFLLQPLIHGERPDDVRNVMLYFCDTLRADALSCYGNPRPTTPTLDAMATSGIRFERCFSQGAWTYVSMPSSLSSLVPSVNGVRTGGERIAGSVTTLAEAFREAGYLTAAFIRNDFVGPTTHTEQGFDFFFQGGAVGAANGLQEAVARAFGNNPADADAGAGTMNFASGSSRDLFNTAQPWLDQYRDVPFVLYLHAVDPHDPYDPEQVDRSKFLSDEEYATYLEYVKKFTDFQTRQQQLQMQQQFGGFGGGFGGGPAVVQRLAAAPAPAAPAPAAPADAAVGEGEAPAGADAATTTTTTTTTVGGAGAPRVAGAGVNPGGGVQSMYEQAGIDAHDYIARKQRAVYDAEVHYFDRHFRRLRDYFDQHGLTGNTIFSFNADHGEEFLDHGATGHGQSVYAELNHVPWILAAPGLVPEARVVPDNVANIDLGPTLLGLAGVGVPETMQGRNLAPELLAGEELPAMFIVTERWSGGMFGGNGGDGSAGDDDDFLGEWAVIEGRWKTIVRRSKVQRPGADGAPGRAEIEVGLEIYDLLADMTDSKSLIESERPRAEAAAQRLVTWLGEMRKLAARYAGEDTSSEDALEMMRALGYAQ